MGEITGIDEKLKMLAFEGVVPSEESIADGSYPLADGYYAVVRRDLPVDHSVRRVISWLKSDDGKESTKGEYKRIGAYSQTIKRNQSIVKKSAMLKPEGYAGRTLKIIQMLAIISVAICAIVFLVGGPIMGWTHPYDAYLQAIFYLSGVIAAGCY